MKRSSVATVGYRSMLGLLGMVILVGMGEKMAERFLPIYLMALGGGPIIIGLLNGLDNLLSALYSLAGGYLADRFGEKRSLLFFNALAIVGFLIVILVPSWPAVLLGSVLFLSWTAISLPATMSLISKVLPKDRRTMGTTLHSLVRRIPMAAGPVAGGLFIGLWGERDGVRIAFVAALAMALVAVVLQQRMITGHADETRERPPSPIKIWRMMGSPLKTLLAADILVRFCEQIPYAFVVVWCMKSIVAPVSALQFGILTTIEMVTAMLIYLPVGYLADRGTKKPYVVTTFVFFTLFPILLWQSRSFEALAAVFVLRGMKEFGEPTRKALILDLSPAASRASVFGLYYLIRDVIVSAAAFGGAFLWEMAPAVNFLTAASCGAAGTLLFGIKGRSAAGPGERPLA